ncbi:MAG: hypothetical protein AB1611_18755 [bacterium]
MKICHHCRKPVEVGRIVSRLATCPHCESYLHCCLNCALYSEYAPNKCREPQSEQVADRGQSNFCDFFTFAETAAGEGADNKPSPLDEVRRKFDALFKQKPE